MQIAKSKVKGLQTPECIDLIRLKARNLIAQGNALCWRGARLLILKLGITYQK